MQQQIDEFGRPIVPQGSKSEGRGCFFYGCITLIVLFILSGTVVYFGFKKLIETYVVQYSSDTQLQLTTVQVRPGDVAEVENRIQSFSAAIDKGENPEPLVLSEKDINVYLQKESFLKDAIHVSIVNDVVKFALSFPLAELGHPGKFINAHGDFKGIYKNGRLEVNLLSFDIKDQPLSEQALKEIQGHNLAENIEQQNPKLGEFLRKLETIEVKDGKIIVVPKKTEKQSAVG